MSDADRIPSRILAAGAALALAGCGWFGGNTEEPTGADHLPRGIDLLLA